MQYNVFLIIIRVKLCFRAFAAWEENAVVDIDAERQLIVQKDEYKKKLIHGSLVLPDPLSIHKKEWETEEAALTKWPPVYYHDIANYLEGINSPGDLLHRLACDYKEGKSYRYFACDFVKEILYNPVSLQSNICLLKSRVTPSQRTSSTPYTVWAAIEKCSPGGKIISAYCSCTAGLLGSCNHVTGMLFRVEAAVSAGVTKPTCTSRLSKWNVPTGTKTVLEMKPIKELTFSKHNYFKGRDSTNNDLNRIAYNSFTPNENIPLESPDALRSNIYGIMKEIIPDSRFVELMECKKKRATTNSIEPELKNFNSTNVIHQSENFIYNHATSLQENVDMLTNSLKITKDKITQIYDITKSQSDSNIWHELRKGRITASKFHNVYTKINSIVKDPSKDAFLLTQSLIQRKKLETVATKHGISMEIHAKNKIIEQLKKTHKKCTITDAGLIIDEDFPYLAASPDLVGYCECCGDFVIEIKCPYSICETIPTADNLSYLIESEGNLKLKQTHNYYSQIQGQIAIAKKKFAWFFIYTHHGYHIERIEYHQQQWYKIKTNLIEFWQRFLGPELLKDKAKKRSTTSVTSDNPTSGTSNNSSSFEKFENVKNCLNPEIAKQTEININKSPKKRLKRKRKVTNVSLPKLYLCSICGEDCSSDPKSFGENSICCSKCGTWLHFHCVNINSEKEIPKKNKKWLCRKCSV